ncbi:hypothetical protein A3C26_01315 [Candidatus Daviesbacteria bacterium RIFCSPHIGHO2_02_FULL_39_12]|uniref:Gamma-glutamylcyclotransferase AIG2-like domain-containing protein n=2 Tax=Candidatus Daviesiibacteriota TaxID=1752718 RepID=A0A1F5JBX8_9BACT|nr:MAG: hypothetical protein A3C26_01315 [Candidatus Daviesbacteria bacterium RIFCSPHIGHO2_02_FULL_39_12]OGE72001.1 MAG: hypothetical protein A3H40_00465 [Candidatus Daviesbacteria bacterium RIFCSPLOWO2_02_FULL_38_15]
MNIEVPLFVYGTLKKGGKWHHLIANEVFLDQDAVHGEMYLEKGRFYPILYTGNDIIKGETYIVRESVYQRVLILESDADYDIKTARAISGREVRVFFFKDESQKDPEKRIVEFHAEEYFKRWLDVTPRNSESYLFWLEWGGTKSE